MTPVTPALMLPIEQIGEMKAENYVGLIDRNAVECLKVRLQAESLRTPIWVRKNGNARKGEPYSVIAGRHRRIAAMELGWTEIAAEVRAGPDSKADELRRLQLAENLDRRVLRPIERACFILDRWRSEALARAWDIVSHARDLDDITGKACGNVDARTIRRYRRLHDELVAPFPDQFALINGHPLGANLSDMNTLASVKLKGRRKAVEMLLSRDDWKSMTEVLVEAGIAESNGNRTDPEKLNAVMSNTWNKLPSDAQRAHLDFLVKQIDKEMANEMVSSLIKRWDL